MSVAASRLEVGEQFAPGQLAEWLGAGGRTPLLLYPNTPQAEALGMVPCAPLEAGLLLTPARLRLVLLDATWRKSRKMLYQNPALQCLPRMALSALAPSRYLIRKAHAPDQRSTLEAVCQALAQLDGDTARYAPLLDAFDGFVAAYAARLPDA